jgi:hypothetical protein
VAWVGYGLGLQRRDGLCSQRWICLRAWRHWDWTVWTQWTEELNNLGQYKVTCKVGDPGADKYSTVKQRMTDRECWPRGISVVSRPRATMTEPFLNAVLRLVRPRRRVWCMGEGSGCRAARRQVGFCESGMPNRGKDTPLSLSWRCRSSDALDLPVVCL